MVYRADEVDVAAVLHRYGTQKRKRGNPKTRNTNYLYKDVVAAFDIETSTIRTGEGKSDYISVMYIWQMQIGLDCTIYGRTWQEFIDLMTSIYNALESYERLLIFVHNLAYEWQYLRDPAILGSLIDEETVFLVDSRRPVKFECYDGRIEFRCSYIHSNMSLDEFTDKMMVEHGKLSGAEFDYSKLRYPWTPLTDQELAYCIHDVLGLVECIYKECQVDKDNLYSLPLTSTGYVRRDIKKAIQKIPHGYISQQLPDYPTYKMLREAFRGGNTHASRFYSNKRIDADIRCMDISSSYPNVLINCRFPITPFREIRKECLNIEHIIGLVKKGRAVLMRIAMYDVKLSDPFWPVPYLSREKCRNIIEAVYDNGRILEAYYLEITITDVDLLILLDEYDADIEVLDAVFATYGYIPDQIRDVVRDYFRRKTGLKNVAGEEIQYTKSKNKLNAIYGMSAQNPVKLEDCYIGGNYVTGIHYHDEIRQKCFMSQDEAELADVDIVAIAHRENIDKSTMPYQWGVWCTAWARQRLEKAIKICGYEFLYCDTDSVYFYGEHDFTAYNREAMRDSKTHGAAAVDPKGKEHYMGMLELDKEMRSFKTMGAKKYAYIGLDGDLHITIAGVGKSSGAAELEEYAGDNGLPDGLDAMTEHFVFRKAGGNESIYNDAGTVIMLDGIEVYAPSNVAIVPSSYTVSMTYEYKDLLEFLLDNNLFRLYQENYKGHYIKSLDI